MRKLYKLYNMNKYFLAFTCFIIFSKLSFSQQNICGMHSNNPQQAILSAQFQQKEVYFNQLAYQYMQQNIGNAFNATTVEIPIVFHVIHQNGPENIADSTIVTEVMRLNQRFLLVVRLLLLLVQALTLLQMLIRVSRCLP